MPRTSNAAGTKPADRPVRIEHVDPDDPRLSGETADDMSRDDARQTRDQQSREAQDWDTVDDTFDPNPDLLTAPPAREGYDQRWVASEVMGSETTTNLARHMRQGFRPRPADSMPKGFYAPTIKVSGLDGDGIGIKGLILMERPKGMSMRVREANQQRLAKQNRAIDNDINAVEDPRVPIKRERKSTIERGRRPEIADDE